jgi:hypothetical protein
VGRRPAMELESGSPSVRQSGSRGRRRASDVGSRPGGGACTRECRCAVLDLRVDAHLAQDVADHVVEDAGSDDAAGS